MNKANSIKLVDNVFDKITEMNVDVTKDIMELIFLLQNNEIISLEKMGLYPINRISEALGIGACTAEIEEDGYLYVDGTTHKLYGYNQVIITNKSYSLKRQREIRANLLGVYLLDYLKNFDGDHRKVYAATYNKTNMDNKARFFASELLTPTSIFSKQYAIASEEHNNPIFIRRYLQEYFDVSSSFVENKIEEIIFGFPLPLESTNPGNINPSNKIVLFPGNYK